MSSNDGRADKQRWRTRLGSSPSTQQQSHGGEAGTDVTSPTCAEQAKVLRTSQWEKPAYRDQPTTVISGATEKGWFALWLSYLMFSWPGRLIELGSTSDALGVEDLDDIQETQKRCADMCLVCRPCLFHVVSIMYN